MVKTEKQPERKGAGPCRICGRVGLLQTQRGVEAGGRGAGETKDELREEPACLGR